MTSHPAIKKKLVFLVKSLDVSKIMTIMVSEGLLTSEEHARLTKSHDTEDQRASELLMNILPRKGSKEIVYERFTKCLVWSGQPDLAGALDVEEDVIKEYEESNPYKENRSSNGCYPLVPTVHVPSQVGGPVFILYVSQHPHDDDFSDVELFVKLLCNLGVECVSDLTVQNHFQIPDWPQWVVTKMRDCCSAHGHIIVVCTEALCTYLHSGQSHQVDMKHGLFNSLTVSNLLIQDSILRRTIPVFLGQTRIVEWMPQCLRSKASVTVNLTDLRIQLKEDLTIENTKKVVSHFQPLVTLVTGLIGCNPTSSRTQTDPKDLAECVNNETVSDRKLRDLAQYLDKDWTLLASKLNVRESQQELIKSEYSNPVEQAYRMLLGWQEEREDIVTRGTATGGRSGVHISPKDELLNCLEQSKWEGARRCLL